MCWLCWCDAVCCVFSLRRIRLDYSNLTLYSTLPAYRIRRFAIFSEGLVAST